MGTTSSIQEATYYAALELVGQIDQALTTGLYHYRTITGGRLLTTLDEVVRAILDNTLVAESLCQDCLRPQRAHPKNEGVCQMCGGDTCSCDRCLQDLARLRAGCRHKDTLGVEGADWSEEQGLILPEVQSC